MGKIIIAGIGPGNKEDITHAALHVIGEADGDSGDKDLSRIESKGGGGDE